MSTPTGLQRLARRAVLIRLKNDAGLLALVAKDSIDPRGTPSWPIVLVEAPSGTPLRMSCAQGAAISFDVHAFAGPLSTLTGYDHASAIGAAVEAALKPNHITLENGAQCRVSFSDMRLLKDADPDHWHWFAQLNCRVLEAVAV